MIEKLSVKDISNKGLKLGFPADGLPVFRYQLSLASPATTSLHILYPQLTLSA